MADPVTVLLPEALRRLFPGAPRQAEVTAGTVAEAIAALDRLWPGMADRLCDSTPAIRRHLNIFVDGERARLDTPIPPRGEMLVMTWISGG
ncbi:MoaD/ThiS family protein [Roseomonas sp. HJA6]|uniref:MoaD/ThiS family protein n=1 Tax=Roseomonas alba TaxID=2846776 RepID=A0ABS7AFM7_9PROT|nr:MoaD/ThiS family protein [Neoroseomonas alba]MBW6401095.1 MoaD/ThiS family protein [Neoroseomonas alba]